MKADPYHAMFRANLQRTGVYETTSVHQVIDLKWKFTTGGMVSSSPALVMVSSISENQGFSNLFEENFHGVKGNLSFLRPG